MVTNAEIGDMGRRELQSYLESWGFAVYDDEPIAELRACARQVRKDERDFAHECPEGSERGPGGYGPVRT